MPEAGATGWQHRLLVDLAVRSAGSHPQSLTTLPSGALLFQADDGTHGSELWVSGGTEASTRRLGDFVAGPADTPPLFGATVADGAYLTATLHAEGSKPRRQSVWFTDGTEAGTRLIYEEPLALEASTLSFSNEEEQHGPLLALGQLACIGIYQQAYQLVCVTREGAVSRRFAGVVRAFAHDRKLVLDVLDPSGRHDLFLTDGIGPTTPLASGMSLGQGVSLGARALALIESEASGRELATLEGELLQVWDHMPGAADGAYSLRRVGARAFLGLYLAPTAAPPARRGRLHLSDGTPEGTRVLADPAPAEDRVNDYSAMTAFQGGYLYTRSGSDGVAMYRTDGTLPADPALPVPSTMVTSLAGAPLEGRIAALDTLALFGQYQPASGTELWITDGAASTRLLRDFYEGGSGLHSAPRVAGGGVQFACQTPETATEVCFTNGTDTPRVHDINTTNTAGWNGVGVLVGQQFLGVESLTNKSGLVRVDLESAAVTRWESNGPGAAGTGPYLSGLVPVGASGAVVAAYASGSTRTLLHVDVATGLTVAAGPAALNLHPLAATEHGVLVQSGLPTAFAYWDGLAAELVPLARANGSAPGGTPRTRSGAIMRIGSRVFVTYSEAASLVPYRVDDAVLVPLVQFGLPAGTVIDQVQAGNEHIFLYTHAGIYRSGGSTDDMVLLPEPEPLVVPPDHAVTYGPYYDIGERLYRAVGVTTPAGATDSERSGAYLVQNGRYEQVTKGYVSWMRSLAGTLVVKSWLDDIGITRVSNERGETLIDGFELDWQDYQPVVDGDRMFLVQDDGVHGVEMWRSDGTPAGTQLLDIGPGARSSNPSYLGTRGERIFLLGDDYAHGYELQVVESLH